MAQGGAKKTIRQLRQERGWTQQDLAQLLGVTQSTVSGWERGLKTQRPRTLLRLAALFGVRIEDIAIEQAERHS